MKNYIEIRYISNSGLVISAEDSSIGIDIFCKDSSKIYRDTPEELKEELFREIENDRLNILIFTHEHEDHFCLEDVKEALKRNVSLKICAGANVRKLLLAEGIAPENIYLIEIEEYPPNVRFEKIDSFTIGFVGTKHDGKRYAHVLNLTLLIEVEDLHLVVIGDALPSNKLFKEISHWSPEINCLFAPFPYVGLPSVRKKIKEHLEVKYIFVMHQPREENETFLWVDQAKKVCAESNNDFPETFFPDKLGTIIYL